MSNKSQYKFNNINESENEVQELLLKFERALQREKPKDATKKVGTLQNLKHDHPFFWNSSSSSSELSSQCEICFRN